MPQDPSKANFSVTNNSTEERSFATISLTAPPESFLNEDESREVDSNQDASKRFELLKRQGLNPLKPIIIANTEFVPISEGTSPDSSGLKVELSDNSVLSVNSVTKLIELHRQIRLATLNAANSVLLNAKGYNINDVLVDLNKLLKISMEEIAKENLSLTVDEVIKRLINFEVKDFSAATSSKKIVKSSAQKAKKNQDASATAETNESDSTQDELTKRSRIRRIFQNNSADPFLRTLVEYSILEIIVFDILQYLSGILSLKEAFSKTWSVYESLSTNMLSNSELKSSSDYLPGTQKFINFSLSTIIAGAFDLEELFQEYTGVKAGSKSSDITLLLQFFISIADELSNRKLLTVSRSASEDIVIGRYPIKNSKDNLGRALSLLQKGDASSLFANLEVGNNSFDSDTKKVYSDQLSENIFNGDLIEKIFDSFPSDMDDIDIFGQMLAGSLINDCIEMSGKTSTISSKNKAFISLGGPVPSSLNSPSDYFRSLINYDGFLYEFLSDKFEYEYDLRLQSQSNPLLKFLSLRDSNTNTQDTISRYLPLESTSYANVNGEPYLTGPEYFLDLSLQRGDFNLIDLNKFAISYRNFTNKFSDDIYNLTRLDECARVLKNLFKTIGNELMTSARDGDSAFLLSLISTQSDSVGGLLRLFRSVYFGSRLDEKKGNSGAGVGDKGDEAYPLESQTGDRRAMRAANQVILRELIDNSFEVPFDEIKFERKNTILKSNGDRIDKAFQHDEYVNRDKEFNRISGGKTLNEGTGESNLRKITYTVHKQSGDNFGSPRDGLNKEETVLEGGANFSTKLCESIKYFLSNKHFESIMFTPDQVSSFNNQREDKSKNVTTVIEVNARNPTTGTTTAVEQEILRKIYNGRNYQGSNVSLAAHHRVFILYGFIAKILNKSLSVKAKSSEADKADTAKVVLTLNADEVEGVAQAFIDVSDGVTRSNTGWNTAKEVAYSNAKSYITKVVRLVEAKFENLSTLISVPVLHSQGLLAQTKSAKNFINFGDGSNRSKLALSVIKDQKINAFASTLNLITKESVGQIYKSHVNTLIRDRFGYTYEDCPNVNQLKLMIKILSTPGYGLLSSEKRGPKTICHVGVTNSLLATLRYEAYKEFSDKNFLNSTRFCVNVFKRNEIDSQILVYPKTFLFDSTYQIVDQDVNGRRLNHIQNFIDTWNFDEIINNIEITKWVQSVNPNSTENPFKNITGSFKAIKQLGESILLDASNRTIEKDVIINHILDYALKIYYRYALGIDFNENSFTLEPIRKISGTVSGGISVDQSLMQGDYDTLINQLRLRYPAANVDQKLASELFRSIEIIAANPIYSLADKVKKAIYPKKFDNVLSVLVNEKDFVLYTPAYDINFLRVYGTNPNFNVTPRIIRPETVRKSKENSTKIINKHIDNCKEEFPEFTSLYTTITILPS